MPYPNEHSCRLADPAKFDRFARVNCDEKHNNKCIDVIYGFKEEKSWIQFVFVSRRRKIDIRDAGGEIQALRYSKDIWKTDDAQAHCKTRDGTFEASE